jgi:predicted transcriptional regulator
MEGSMTTVTIGLASEAETRSRMRRAFQGEAQGTRLSFSSVELLWRIIAPKRWELLQVMTGAGPLAIREIARRVGRDVKSVHGDIHALLEAGVVDRTSDRRVVFPYDKVHVDFVMRAA